MGSLTITLEPTRLLAYAVPLSEPANFPAPVMFDSYGKIPSIGLTIRTHQGIDIFAKRGTPVLSATSGIVLDVGLNSLGGQVVWVMGPNLSRHYYAHLDAYAPDIQTGDWVEVGEVLGYVGNTGNTKNTPPHLHYGIYRTGKGAVNPYPYLTLNALK